MQRIVKIGEQEGTLSTQHDGLKEFWNLGTHFLDT